MSKKRMWSEKEITDYIFGCIIIAVIISFLITLFMLSFYSNLKGFIDAEWQPYNCVNETEETLVYQICNETIEFDGIWYKTQFCKSKVIEVPTGRQICSQEILVRNVTRVI